MSRTDSEPTDMAALRRAWALADESDADGGRGRSAVDDERVWRAVAGELAPEEIRALATEAATNPELARSWRLARELHAAASEEPSVERAKVVAQRFSPAKWALAAMVILGLALGLRFGLRPDGAPSSHVVRGGVSAVAISAITPEGSALSRDKFVLRWSQLPDPRARYTLRVSTPDLRLVAEEEDLDSAEYRLDAPALAGVPAGTKIFWQVEARLPDGRVETSNAFAVVLRD